MKHPLSTPMAKGAFGALAVAGILGAGLAPATAPVAAPRIPVAVQSTCTYPPNCTG